MVGPVRVPLAVEVRRAQVEHRLRAIGLPTHSGTLHSVFHQMPTRPFDYATADRVTRRKILVVLHPRPVPLEIPRHLTHRLATCPLQSSLGHHLTPAADHITHLPLQEHPQFLLHPMVRLWLLRRLVEETPRRLPQSLQDME